MADTPATKFRIGSMTKQFTAAAVLLLEEQGKLKIQYPIKNYLPDPPPAWDSITIFHILTHTSGFPRINEPSEGPKLKPLPVTPEQHIAKLRKKPLEFIPGSQYKYSNAGYILLRWELGLFGGKLLSAESLKKMTTPFKGDYGLGLHINMFYGQTQISHGGGIEGFNTHLEYYPDSKITVIVSGT